MSENLSEKIKAISEEMYDEKLYAWSDEMDKVCKEIERLEAIESRLKRYSDSLYQAKKTKWNVPDGYIHAIPWFLVENKIQWVLTGVDHISEIENTEQLEGN